MKKGQAPRWGASVLCAMMIVVSDAAAQLSITTFGATDAQACFEAASDNFSTSVNSCNKALGERRILNNKDIANTYVNRGIIFNRTGRLSSAVDDFAAALEVIPGLAEAYLNRGNSFYLMKRFSQALEQYDTALTLGIRKEHAAWYNIGLTYEAMKMLDKAHEAYEKSLAANPDFAPAKKKLTAFKKR